MLIIFIVISSWIAHTEINKTADITSKMSNWVEACEASEIDAEDVIRVDLDGVSYAIYRSPDDQYYCTQGHCTHEQVHLAEGLVMDNIIECPKHNGQFDYTTGEALRVPACEALKTYDTRLENGKVLISV